MSDIILWILYRLSKSMRERYPDGFVRPWSANNHKMEDAVHHVNLYNGWGLLAVAFAAAGSHLSKWFLLGLLLIPALAAQSLWKEFIFDAHWKRIKLGIETPEEYLDFKTDLITRFAGLFAPSVAGIAAIVFAFVF